MQIRDHWQLNPDIDFLNHGSFGACPSVVLQEQQNLISELENDPIRFLAPERELTSKLDEVRDTVASLVKVPASDLAFVRNATDGVNAVLNSLPLKEGDQILITNHGYNACNNAARHVAEKTGAEVTVAEIPFPLDSDTDVIVEIEKQITPQTRLILIDHVTSPTGLIFPVEQVISLAHAKGIQVLVDGAHAPGMIPLNLTAMAPDYYTANHHKWLCGPKTSGFLFVQPELQTQVRPNLISHGANRKCRNRSRFITEFDWTGTYDPTPLLAVPAAILFLETLYPEGLDQLYQKNHDAAVKARQVLCHALQTEPPSSNAMIGSMASVPLDATRFTKHECSPAALQQILFQQHRLELPVFQLWDSDHWCLRISMQAYNEVHQIDRLGSVLTELTG
ncbi:MAG: penicillin epimerase [Rhodopirellula sp.]|nr:penicillin epimerase [Rhodopirellula sp.]